MKLIYKSINLYEENNKKYSNASALIRNIVRVLYAHF